jgi:energy-coupling factor transporter ATP-binding protein EcfA2
VIELHDVGVTYADAARPVLTGVALTIPEGELALVVGRTGSGKSTLLRTINGLVPHFSGGTLHGRVLVDGRDTRTHRPRDLADIVGYVGQDPLAGFVTDTVEDELAYGMESLGLSTDVMRKRVEETLDLLGLAEVRGRPVADLSGGQQQRVAIAQAIVDDAELLLLDEPLANLDLRNQQEIVRLLGELHRERDVTILVVAHDLNPLLPVLTEAVYLLDGHPHHDPITDVVQEELLTHLYGTPVGVVRTAQGDLFTRAAWRDPQR